MNGLAICAGVEGIELGIKLIEPRYRTVCYVEGEVYAAAIIRKRMEEKLLDEAPIWDDIRTFDGKQWRGKVDIITAGFPCQPWSVAGKQRRTEDERWIWDDISRVVGEVRPQFVFLENVPGLVTGGGASIILGNLAQIGYDAELLHLSAAQVGANHKRQRVWILAHANTERELQQDRGKPNIRGRPCDSSKKMAHPHSNGEKRDKPEHRQGCGTNENSTDVENPRHMCRGNIGALEGRNNSQRERTTNNSEIGGPSWWAVEPNVGRVVDGLPHRVDRLRACGNGVVPLVAATAFRELKRRITPISTKEGRK